MGVFSAVEDFQLTRVADPRTYDINWYTSIAGAGFRDWSCL